MLHLPLSQFSTATNRGRHALQKRTLLGVQVLLLVLIQQEDQVDVAAMLQVEI